MQRQDYWKNVSWMMMKVNVSVLILHLRNLIVYLVLGLVNNFKYLRDTCYLFGISLGDETIDLEIYRF